MARDDLQAFRDLLFASATKDAEQSTRLKAVEDKLDALTGAVRDHTAAIKARNRIATDARSGVTVDLELRAPWKQQLIKFGSDVMRNQGVTAILILIAALIATQCGLQIALPKAAQNGSGIEANESK